MSVPPASQGGSAAGAEPALLTVVVRPEGYAVLSMHKEPVNSLNLAMWQQLEQVCDEAFALRSGAGAVPAWSLPCVNAARALVLRIAAGLLFRQLRAPLNQP